MSVWPRAEPPSLYRTPEKVKTTPKDGLNACGVWLPDLWIRARNLRINSTAHSLFYGVKIEDFEVAFFWVPGRITTT